MSSPGEGERPAPFSLQKAAAANRPRCVMWPNFARVVAVYRTSWLLQGAYRGTSLPHGPREGQTMKTWLYRGLLVGLVLSMFGCAAPTAPTVFETGADGNRAQLHVLQADLDVIQKRKELANLPPPAASESRATAEQNLRMAQLKANLAYQAAGLSVPYPDANPR